MHIAQLGRHVRPPENGVKIMVTIAQLLACKDQNVGGMAVAQVAVFVFTGSRLSIAGCHYVSGTACCNFYKMAWAHTNWGSINVWLILQNLHVAWLLWSLRWYVCVLLSYSFWCHNFLEAGLAPLCYHPHYPHPMRRPHASYIVELSFFNWATVTPGAVSTTNTISYWGSKRLRIRNVNTV